MHRSFTQIKYTARINVSTTVISNDIVFYIRACAETTPGHYLTETCKCDSAVTLTFFRTLESIRVYEHARYMLHHECAAEYNTFKA